MANVSYDMFDDIFSLIEIDKINSKEEFDLFVSKLINHPNPTREAVSYELPDLYRDDFLDMRILDIFVCAICDINPNVSRNMCQTIEKSPLLQNKIEKTVIDKIKSLITDLGEEDILKNNKNHAKNKKLFSLYWLLEALSFCCSERYNSEVLEILKKTVNFSDYTIREKTAKILTKMPNCPDDLLKIISHDSNFYVNFYIKK